MKFLQLTKKFPYPPYDGESLLISNFNKILKKNVEVLDLLTFNTIKHYFDIKKYPQEENPYNNIDEVFLDNRIKPVDAFVNLFSKIPYNISRFISGEFENKLKDILKNNSYDYILMESVFLLPYVKTIKKYSNAKIILRSHNVEYEIWERIAKNSRNIPLKLYTLYLAKKLKKFELTHINKIDILVTLTDRDLKKYTKNGYNGKSMIVPAGIISEIKPQKIDIKDNLEVSFLGSLDWMPNIEGLNWFIKNVWKEIIKDMPGSRLHIAGRNTPDTIKQMQNQNLVVHGEIPDSKIFLNSYPIMIVPLLSGGGMRLKIMEALALGRVIITTSLGTEGIDAKDEKDILIANTPKEFIDKIKFCYSNPEKLNKISKNAISLFQNRYNLNQMVESFLENISN